MSHMSIVAGPPVRKIMITFFAGGAASPARPMATASAAEAPASDSPAIRRPDPQECPAIDITAAEWSCWRRMHVCALHSSAAVNGW